MARETFPSKVTFFPLDTDGTYGAAVKLKNCVKFDVKFNRKESEYRSDGAIERYTTRIESADVELELSSNLALKDESSVTGTEYLDGMAITNERTIPVNGAISYEIFMDDGTVRRRCLRNVALAKDDISNETDSEGSTFTFSGKAIPDEDGDVMFVLDEKEVQASTNQAIKAIWDNFFTEPAKRPAGL